MADTEPEHNPDEVTVRIAVARMLMRNDWRLLEIDELTRQVLGLLSNRPEQLSDAQPYDVAHQIPAQSGHSARTGAAERQKRYSPIEGAALRAYSQAIYAAFASRTDEDRQRRAYDELFRYIFRATSGWAADLSRDEREEIAYHVLAELYFRLVAGQPQGQQRAVRDPGALLAVVLQQMKNTVRQWRATTRHWAALSTQLDMRADDSSKAESLSTSNEADDPNLYVERDELRAQVVRLFTGSFQRYPRARIQLHVVWLHQIENLDYIGIADRLAMTVDNVRVLYSRGIKRLRNEPGFRALAEQEQLAAVQQPERSSKHRPDTEREHGT